MKEIVINSKIHGRKIVLVDDEDYDWLSKYRWSIITSVRNKNLYCQARVTPKINGKYKYCTIHRFICSLESNNGKVVDHRDKNTLNNQRSNLRVCTQSENMANSSPRKNGTSKHLGVCWDTKRNLWFASITKNYKQINIGFFSSERDAALAYNERAIEIHGEFANLNFMH